MSATILLVEDDETARGFMAPLLRDAGYDVREAATLAAAHQSLDRSEADLIVLDVQLPDGYGPSLMERINREQPGIPVIVVTGYGDVATAVESMKLGASDFIEKPVDMNTLLPAVNKAAEQVALRRELDHLRTAHQPQDHWIIGETPAMRRVAHDIARVAPSNATVLITGASGTGKEVVAGAIHRMSPRANKPWIPVNCANLSETLLESELFGYEAGAFTGATKRKEGLFVTANTGTLFLDEISAMRHELQARLLRVLEDRSIRRLGGTTETKVDVRIIAASNRDLKKMVEANTFREDLYHRLNVVEIRLPTLAERKEDIPALVGFFIKKYNREMARNVEDVRDDAMEALKAYRWPGNIRELRNAIERAMVYCDGPILELGHFTSDIVEALDRVPA